MARVSINVEGVANEIGVAPGGLVSVVNRGITEGWSQRQTIAVGRALDMHFSDTTFRQLWHHQEDVQSRMADVLSHDPSSPIDPQLVSGSQWGKVGTYYHWITIVRRVAGSGELIEDTSVQSSDEIRSADDVVGDMFDQWAEHDQEYSSGAGIQTVGAYVYSVTQRIE